MAVNSQGRAHVEQSLLEVCFLTRFGHSGRSQKVQPQLGSRRGESRNSPCCSPLRRCDLKELPQRTRNPAEASSPYGTSCREATRLDGNPMRAIIIWRCWLLALNDVVSSEGGAERARGGT